MNIEFVSYTGEFPNLCRGTLTLRIDGKEVIFGNNYRWNKTTCKVERIEGTYDSFWASGGCCGFHNNYSDEYVETAPWEINSDKLPEKYRECADEIAEVFNNNVNWAVVVAVCNFSKSKQILNITSYCYLFTFILQST